MPLICPSAIELEHGNVAVAAVGMKWGIPSAIGLSGDVGVSVVVYRNTAAAFIGTIGAIKSMPLISAGTIEFQDDDINTETGAATECVQGSDGPFTRPIIRRLSSDIHRIVGSVAYNTVCGGLFGRIFSGAIICVP